MAFKITLVNNSDVAFTLALWRDTHKQFEQQMNPRTKVVLPALYSIDDTSQGLRAEVHSQTANWNFVFKPTWSGPADAIKENHYAPENRANICQHIGAPQNGVRDLVFSFGPAFSSRAWMQLLDIDANTTLADITLPGTHDTGTWNGNGNDRCQSMNFLQQLEWGIRWFDLRLVVNGEDMEIYHSGDRQNVYLAADILPVLKQFLVDNPTETVVLCVNHEFGIGGHSNDTPNPRGRDFDGLLHDLLMRGVTPNKLYDQPTLPKLAGLGGCIVLMRRDKGATFGIRQLDKWPGDSTGTFTSGIGNVTFSVQDAYKYGGDYLTAKWNNVKNQLQDAARRKDGNAWYINFTSASRAPLTTPIEIAIAEPDLQGVNYQFHGYLCSQTSPVHLGTIPMDFPEKPYGLVKLLISMNKLKGV